jgi:hypothetical protein
MSWLLLVVRISITNYVDIEYKQISAIVCKFKSIMVSFIYSLRIALLNAVAGIR